MHLLSVFTAAALLASAAPALAQTATAPVWTSDGFNGASAAVAAPFNPSTRDANNNRVVINGEIQTAGATSVQEQFASLSGGAMSAATGAGPNSAATAIGNQLTVQVSGSWNTVVVSATQTNSAVVTATAGASTATAQQKASGNGQ